MKASASSGNGMRPMRPAPASFSSGTPAGCFRQRYRPRLGVLYHPVLTIDMSFAP
jgi:hypothetical protein